MRSQRLKKHVRTIPVLGNGDIWEAHDALRMMRSTGCDGVVIGRGCLGRPWLFRDLADVFEGREPQNPPTFGEVAEIAVEHAALLSEWAGEAPAMRMFRRHSSWYTKGFRGSAKLRARLMRVTTLERARRSPPRRATDAEPFPPGAMRVPRGKTAGRQRVSLPEGFLENRLTDDTSPLYVDPGSGG